MNRDKVTTAISTIAKHELALEWIRGPGMKYTGQSDEAVVEITPLIGDGGEDQRAARAIIERELVPYLPVAIANSARVCEAAIAAAKEIIREELGL
jgi:hypothetical protein